MKLLDLSQRLPLDGEITPIMAWTMIRGDARFGKLGKGDFEALKEALKPKVRCYGYVMLFHVRVLLQSRANISVGLARCLKSSRSWTLFAAFRLRMINDVTTSLKVASPPSSLQALDVIIHFVATVFEARSSGASPQSRL